MAEQSNPNELDIDRWNSWAHVGSNTVAVGDLPQLIGEVYRTLATLGAHGALPERPEPAVPVKKSITPDYIVCLEDGKKLKMLKRHLKTAYDHYSRNSIATLGSAGRLSDGRPELRASIGARLAKKIGLGTRPRRRRRGAS